MRACGVWCLEASWGSDVTSPTSVRPILHVLATPNPDRKWRVPSFYARVATGEEFAHLLRRWSLKKHAKYAVLYIAAHGEPGGIAVGTERLSLDDIAYHLEGRCAGRVVVFGTCATMGATRRQLERFLVSTGAAAVMGYKTDVAWMPATAFELMLLDTLSENSFTGPGLVAMTRKVRRHARAFGKGLSFRIVTRLE